MKSVTIKGPYRNEEIVIIKVIHRKTGTYEVTRHTSVPERVVIEIRDEKGCKVVL